jgi:hypothetical protein
LKWHWKSPLASSPTRGRLSQPSGAPLRKARTRAYAIVAAVDATTKPGSPGDYLIAFTRAQWLTCAGVRSTGLTASLAIGEHVARLLGALSSVHWPSTASQAAPRPLATVVWPRLPDLADLEASYADRNDGYVEIAFIATDGAAAAAEGAAEGAGCVTIKATHRVAHPQTRFGLSTRPPFR